MFSRALQENNLYELRVCKHILDRLENAGQREPSPVQEYTIEHIMPQEIAEVPEWQRMLGERWRDVHATWLHRLGNLTLTAYNSTYSNRAFEEKKAIEGGFSHSAVRLNQYVREQQQWSLAQMQERGLRLTRQALTIWPYHAVDEEHIQAADIRALRERAADQDTSNLEVSDDVRNLLDSIRESINELGNVIEVVEHKFRMLL